MRQHGTRAMYVAERCRCEPCRAAHRDYNREWERRRSRAQVWGIEEVEPAFVDVTEARDHLAWLSGNGVGSRTVSEVTGLARSTVLSIARGEQVVARQETIDRILAVGTHRAPDVTLVDAAPAWRLIDDLVYLGFTKGRIAMAMGKKKPAMQLNRHRITRRSLDKVKAVYTKLLRETATWHGTYAGYAKRRCRCLRCREVAAEYKRQRRETAA
jgi:hypothetical protein